MADVIMLFFNQLNYSCVWVYEYDTIPFITMQKKKKIILFYKNDNVLYKFNICP